MSLVATEPLITQPFGRPMLFRDPDVSPVQINEHRWTLSRSLPLGDIVTSRLPHFAGEAILVFLSPGECVWTG